MSAAVYTDWDARWAPAELSHALFDGALVRFRGLAETLRLAELGWTHVSARFDGAPEGAESVLAPEDFRKRAMAARKAVKDDPEIQALWRDLLTNVGYAPVATKRDLIRLRVVPSRSAAASRFARILPPHRDSWGSAIAAQVNWWMPLRPLTAGATMRIWPDTFRAEIANSSGTWDYDRVKTGDRSVPLLPEATEPPVGDPVDILLEPGDLLAFSAAHLHDSGTGAGGKTRFSMDTRTVWDGDVSAGRAAPMQDLAPGVPERWDMFERESA